MKIAGFNIGKKHLIIIGVVVLFALILAKCSSNSSEARHQEQLESAKQNSSSNEVIDDNPDEEDDGNKNLDPEKLAKYDLEQQGYIKSLGFPPEGYIWNDEGKLVAASSNDDTPEDVVYGFLGNIRLLDFSTANRYASTSVTMDSYKSYYEDNIGDVSTTTSFLRKLYKLSLTELEIVEVADTAVFPDGTEFVTVKVKGLDLTNKDFWKDDRDEIFKTLYSYSSSEKDNDKMLAYLYDYIYKKYSSGTIPKKEYDIELTLQKGINKGWLVSDDTNLYNVVTNPEGNNLYQYILDDFEKYSDAVQEKEDYN